MSGHKSHHWVKEKPNEKHNKIPSQKRDWRINETTKSCKIALKNGFYETPTRLRKSIPISTTKYIQDYNTVLFQNPMLHSFFEHRLTSIH